MLSHYFSFYSRRRRMNEQERERERKLEKNDIVQFLSLSFFRVIWQGNPNRDKCYADCTEEKEDGTNWSKKVVYELNSEMNFIFEEIVLSV